MVKIDPQIEQLGKLPGLLVNGLFESLGIGDIFPGLHPDQRVEELRRRPVRVQRADPGTGGGQARHPAARLAPRHAGARARGFR